MILRVNSCGLHADSNQRTAFDRSAWAVNGCRARPGIAGSEATENPRFRRGRSPRLGEQRRLARLGLILYILDILNIVVYASSRCLTWSKEDKYRIQKSRNTIE